MKTPPHINMKLETVLVIGVTALLIGVLWLLTTLH